MVRGNAVKEWLAGLPALVQIAHIGPPPPLLPLPPQALPRSALRPQVGGVPGLEIVGGGRGGVRSPAQPACGGGLYVVPPAQLDWWMGLCHGEVGVVCDHADKDW